MEEKPANIEEPAVSQPLTDQPEIGSPTPVIEQKQKIKKFVILGVILGILAVVGTTFGVYKLGQRQIQPSQPNPSPTVTTSPTSDLTTDWRVYKNETLGFEFKYPNDPKWNIKENLDTGSVVLYNYDVDKAPGRMYDPSADGDLFKIEIYVNKKYSNSEQWFEEEKQKIDPLTEKPNEFSNIKSITVDSQKGIYYETKANSDQELGSIVFESPRNELIHFQGGLNYEGNKETFNLILSTFKFLKEEEEWEVYNNESQGISFNYPPDWTARTESQNFENGDLFSIYIIGPTQKEDTEFYDGAFFTVAIPLSTSATLEEWLDLEGWTKLSEATGELPEITKGLKLGNEEAVQVYICGLGCFTYRFAKHEGKIYGIVYFAEGDQKSEYEKDISRIISTLRFLD